MREFALAWGHLPSWLSPPLEAQARLIGDAVVTISRHTAGAYATSVKNSPASIQDEFEHRHHPSTDNGIKGWKLHALYSKLAEKQPHQIKSSPNYNSPICHHVIFGLLHNNLRQDSTMHSRQPKSLPPLRHTKHVQQVESLYILNCENAPSISSLRSPIMWGPTAPVKLYGKGAHYR